MKEQSWLRQYGLRYLCAFFAVISLMAMAYTYLQPHFPATITAIGKTTHRSRTTRRHHRSTSYYQTTLTVSYTDETGAAQSAQVRYTYTSPWNPPKAGQQLEITQGLTEMVTYPNNRLRVGALVLLVASSMGLFIGHFAAADRQKKEEQRPLDAPPAAPSPGPGAALDRVTQQPSGAYRWVCAMDKEYERQSYRTAMIACGIIGAFILLVGLFLALQERAWGAFLIVVLADVIFLYIAFLVCWRLSRLPGGLKEVYELTEDAVKIGARRYAMYFPLKKITQAAFHEQYIELKASSRHPRVYVPKEDMPFVKSYLLERIPDTAVVVDHTAH